MFFMQQLYKFHLCNLSMEAVRTNIIGTENLLNAALHNNVEKVICLSTDKAVYPINAMGVSKSLMEKVL